MHCTKVKRLKNILAADNINKKIVCALLWRITSSRQLKSKPPFWRFKILIPGGDEGIRTLDTLASIPHFQCGALDQLCDVSGFLWIFYSSSALSSGMSSSTISSAGCADSSTKEFSNSASISRNIGSSVAISREASSSNATGASL